MPLRCFHFCRALNIRYMPRPFDMSGSSFSTLYQRRYDALRYQSCEGPTVNEGNRHLSTVQVVDDSRNASTCSTPLRSSKISWLALFVIAWLTVISIVNLTPDETYLDIVDEYNLGDVPIFGKSRGYFKAQNVADHFRLNSLEPEPEKDAGKKGHDQETIEDNGIKAVVGCESTVVLLRHCEKENEYEHCNFLGYERSAFLPFLFGDSGERWPLPSYIFALNPAERGTEWKRNFREVELVLPLAEKANSTIISKYGTEDSVHLSKRIHSMLKSGELCGKIAVVSWKHEDLPKLARRLGCGPTEGCPVDYRGSTFDQVWQIKFVYRIPFHSTRKRDEKHGKLPEKSRWWIYGSVLPEGFDALEFSKKAGDYPEGGKDKGGSWMFDFASDPRRKKIEVEEKKINPH